MPTLFFAGDGSLFCMLYPFCARKFPSPPQANSFPSVASGPTLVSGRYRIFFPSRTTPFPAFFFRDGTFFAPLATVLFFDTQRVFFCLTVMPLGMAPISSWKRTMGPFSAWKCATPRDFEALYDGSLSAYLFFLKSGKSRRPCSSPLRRALPFRGPLDLFCLAWSGTPNTDFHFAPSCLMTAFVPSTFFPIPFFASVSIPSFDRTNCSPPHYEGLQRRRSLSFHLSLVFSTSDFPSPHKVSPLHCPLYDNFFKNCPVPQGNVVHTLPLNF